MNAERSLFLALALVMPWVAGAAQTLETAYRTNGKETQAAFESVRQVLQSSSAIIRVQRENITDRVVLREVVYGTVVSPDGYILTKASEIEGLKELSVTVDRQEYRKYEVLEVDPLWDVALLKVDATGLMPVRLSEEPEPERGTWVVANDATTRLQRRLRVGIISANARTIPPGDATVLGVTLDEEDGRLRVMEVHDEGGAAKAGIQEDDLILALDGNAVSARKELGEELEKFRVGDRVAVTIERKGERLDIEVDLSGRAELFGEEPSRNDMMSGRFSERRYDFPRVIQHDIVANAWTIGGPLLDLGGNCLGMNIARVNRCETFAIPAAELKGLAERMIAAAKVP